MQTEAATLSVARCGGVTLAIAEETYRLTRGALHTLLFYGQSVPLVRRRESVHPGGVIVAETVIDGYVSVHLSGRVVIVETRAGQFAVPFGSFQQVARGEVISAPLVPVAQGDAGGVL